MGICLYCIVLYYITSMLFVIIDCHLYLLGCDIHRLVLQMAISNVSQGSASFARFSKVSMMTSSNGNIFRVTGPLCGEFTGLRWIPHTKASDAELWCFFDLHLIKRLSKHSRGWWFETLSRPLWRHCNAMDKQVAVGKDGFLPQFSLITPMCFVLLLQSVQWA